MKKLGFGLMRLPMPEGGAYGDVDIEKVKRMADTLMENGFTYFDTAACYHRGNSEIAFREAVAKRYPRSKYTITDKLTPFMVNTEQELPGFFAAQLERLGVAYMDYYWLHALTRDSYRKMTELNSFAFLMKLRAEGKVKHIGFSFHDKAELLDEILTAHPEMEYVQLQLNYLDWDDPAVESGKCYEVATRHGKPVIVMEPIKGGCLANVPDDAEKLFKAKRPELSVASWAIRYAASLPNVMMVLSGMSDEEQALDNASYMKDFVPLDNAEHMLVKRVAEIIRASVAIPCTACRYCVDDCPKHIAIPDYFAVYNNLKRFGQLQHIVAATYYNSLSAKHGKASECLKCGLCEKRCPQHLPIRKYLEDVARELE